MKRNKSLPLILGAFASIALGSVGFSAWIIGYKTTTTTLEGIGVAIEDVKYATLDGLKVSFSASEERLNLSEGENIPELNDKPSLGSMLEGTPKFDINATLEFNLTKTFVELYDVTAINFTLPAEQNTSNKSGLDTIGKRSSGPWTYVDLKPASATQVITLPTDITTSNGGWTSSVVNSEKEEYKISKTIKIEFDWGTYFNSQKPTAYYSSKLTGRETKEEVDTYLDKVATELTAMKSNLKTITLNAELTTGKRAK